MTPRIDEEIGLLRQRFESIELGGIGDWVLIPQFAMPNGWSLGSTKVAFQVPAGYPATAPYGIYVPSGISFQGAAPNNFSDPAPTQPPFEGRWAVFSWQPDTGAWRPGSNVRTGSNLLNWVQGFSTRFREGV